MADPAAPADWSRLSIVLHWLIVLLVILQFLTGGSMADFFDKGLDAAANARRNGYMHLLTGCLIFFAALARLADRSLNGRPPVSAHSPTWAVSMARVTHVALYGLLVGMPLVGMTGWIFHVELIAQAHGLAARLLIVVVALHVAGALVEHVVFKTDVLRRIIRRSRPAARR